MGTESGKALISIMLGLGAASLFRRKPCSSEDNKTSESNCNKFVSPDMSSLSDKVYKYGEDCFMYKALSSPCDNSKINVEVSTSTINTSN